MENWLVLNLCLFTLLVSVLCASQGGEKISLEAKPHEIIPGLTSSLTVTCTPGTTHFRQIFLVQLLDKQSNTPLATLTPGQSPQLVVTDPRISVTGQLDNASPASASLSLTVDRPMSFDAGSILCRITGLAANGNDDSHTATVDITVHPESNLVDDELKQMVADLRREADAMLQQTQTLQAENLRLNQVTAAKRQALADKRAELQQLRSQFLTLQQSVADREVTLNQTAEELVQEIANVTRDAPPMRVAFNAAERTERTYTSGKQITLETVELNDGNGYNASKSVFQAPVAGVYFFSSAQLAHDTASAAYRTYSIRKNSTVVGSAYNGDDRQSSQFSHSSTGIIVSVTPYDLIRLYQQYSSSATTTLTPYSNTPNGLSTNLVGYLLY